MAHSHAHAHGTGNTTQQRLVATLVLVCVYMVAEVVGGIVFS